MNAFDAITITLNPAIDRTLTISNFALSKVNRVEQTRDNPGGKGVNVASTLADCGYRVAATGFLGKVNAAEFECLFTEKQIADHFIRIEGQTRIGIKITDPATQQTTDINFPGLTPTPADFIALDLCMTRLAAQESTWFILSGSLPPGAPPTIYRDLIAMLRKAGHKILLDTSGEPLRPALESAPHIFKPNLHELQSLLGIPLTNKKAIIAAAKSLLTDVAEMVVVSMGQQGALFVTKNQAVTALPPRIDVASTVGAGDAMVAGIVAAQIRNSSLPDCALLATALSLHRLTCSPTLPRSATIPCSATIPRSADWQSAVSPVGNRPPPDSASSQPAPTNLLLDVEKWNSQINVSHE